MGHTQADEGTLAMNEHDTQGSDEREALPERSSPTEDVGAVAGIPAGSAAKPKNSFRIRTLITAFVVSGLIGGVMVAWVSGLDQQVANFLSPKLVPVTGRVTYRGKPLTTGLIDTRPVGRDVMGGLSGIDENGRFELRTNGKPGTYVGEHKVVIISMSAGFPPQPLIPGRYGEFRATPLSIEVTTNAEDNQFEIELEDE